MTAASIVLSLTLFGIAIWLEMRERDEPHAGDADTTFDDDYLIARQRGRRSVHVLLGISAFLIFAAGLAGPGPVWVALWLAVCGLLILVMMLGVLDFYRTNRYFARKLPQLREQVLESSTGDPTAGSPARGDEHASDAE